MPITETSVQDVLDVKEKVESHSLAGLKAAKSYLPQAIASLQRNYERLRSIELSLLNRIFRLSKLSDIEKEHSANRFKTVEPIQSYQEKKVGTPDPAARISHASNRLERYAKDIQFLDSEIRKIQDEMMLTLQSIDELKRELEEVENALEKEKKRISEADLEKDLTARMKVEEVYRLYEINQEYRMKTTRENGSVGYTQDPKIVRLLEIYQRKFQALARKNSYVLSGDLVLDFTNVGSQENTDNLLSLLERLRVVAQNEKVLQEADKYSNRLVNYVNDKIISKILNRNKTKSRDPAPDNAQKEKNKDTGSAIGFLGQVYRWTKLANDTASEATEAAFLRKTSGWHNKLAFCDREPTEEESDRDAAEAQQTAAEDQGAEQFSDELNRIQ